MKIANLVHSMVLTAFGLGLSARADVVTDWNSVALNAIKLDKTAPPVASRRLAILHTAIYDSVNGIKEPKEQRFEQYLVKRPGHPRASEEAAACAAARRVLNHSFPAQQATFDTYYSNRLALIRDGKDKIRGIGYGEFVAQIMLVGRANDGSTNVVPYTPGSGPGYWQPSPRPNPAGPPAELAGLPALLPNWGAVRPFVMRSGAQFRPPPPPALDSAQWAAEYNLTRQVGSKTSTIRTADQTDIAKFWADGAGTVTPPGHWNKIAQDVAGQLGNTMDQNARLFALLNIAEADAAICCWDAKYAYNWWRPITAIRAGDTDANAATDADPAWTPLLVTPPFPEHTSGHSTFSGAAATVLALYFGRDNVAFTTTSEDLPGVSRRFPSFSGAALEAGISRIYGGIHFMSANVNGLDAGADIGRLATRRYMGPIGGHHHQDDDDGGGRP